VLAAWAVPAGGPHPGDYRELREQAHVLYLCRAGRAGTRWGGAMSRLRRAATAAGRCVVWLMPARRREWAEALWAETGAVPPGRPRLAWRAGGLRLVGGQVLTGRRVRRVLLFAAAATLMARATWPAAAGDAVAAFARAPARWRARPARPCARPAEAGSGAGKLAASPLPDRAARTARARARARRPGAQ